MTRARLQKIEELHRALRRKGGVSAREVQELAASLGRTKFTGRGKEPTWINPELPHLRPVSIPDHGKTRDLKLGTKNNILSQLQADIDAWNEKLAPTKEEDND